MGEGMTSRQQRAAADSVDAIAAMRESGATYQKIANQLGLKVSSVRWQCLKDGIHPPPTCQHRDKTPKKRMSDRGGRRIKYFTPEEDRELLRLERAGLNYAEIARALGRARNSVRNRLFTLAFWEERRSQEGTIG